MDKIFAVSTTIKRDLEDVFMAIVEREQMRNYFTDSADRSLEEGMQVVWYWEGHGDHPVDVVRLVPHSLIELTLNSVDWNKSENDAYNVTVLIELELNDKGHTVVTISESGWKTDGPGRQASHENCGGWMHMVLCLKAYLEHGIDLRK